MRILLSFETFAGFGGTETYILTNAVQFERLGHEVVIYSPQRGAMAEFARTLGIEVVGTDQLPAACDLLIASDNATGQELAVRYGDAVRLLVVHSSETLFQAPGRLRDRCDAVVALNDRVQSSVEARGWHPRVVRLRQPIDLRRFRGRGQTRSTAHTALVLGNYLDGVRAQLVEGACRARGLRVEWIGARNRPTPTPELAIEAAELVIGQGRCVLEAMACERAAFVYGIVGGDGWVTPESYAALEADGFGGIGTDTVIADVDTFAEMLGDWDEHMGGANRDLVSRHHSARAHATELLELARSLEVASPVEPTLAEEIAHLVRLQWHAEGLAWAYRGELDGVRAELERQKEAVVAGHDRSRVLGEMLIELKQTRRYRLATMLSAPLELLKRARQR